MMLEPNQIAFNALRELLAAGQSCSLTVAGTPVDVSVTKCADEPWPTGGVPGVAPAEAWPGAVEAKCTWPGGSATLTVECLTQRRRSYYGDVILRVSTPTQWLLWRNVRVAIDRQRNAELCALTAQVWFVKRRRDGGDVGAHLNAVLRDLLAASRLPQPSRGVAEICKFDARTGAIEGDASAAFDRAVELALLKLEFVDRRGAPDRGRPLIDLTAHGISPEELAIVDGEISDDDDGSEQDETPADPTARLKRRLERAIPDEKDRRAALEVLAFAIQNADDERSDAWYVREKSGGLSLFAGRLLACQVSRSQIDLSVMGPIAPEVLASIGAEIADNNEWKAIPGGVTVSFHVEKAEVALELLKDRLDAFIDEAMARVRRSIAADRHDPATIDYLAEFLGRQLPQPALRSSPDPQEDDDSGFGDDDTATREPRARGRAPIFEHGQRSIASLISDIEEEVIALPNLQRPFVWEDTKVRDLLDSLFVGFPVGTLVLWHVSEAKDARLVGRGANAARASALVIDGQQRLTALLLTFTLDDPDAMTLVDVDADGAPQPS